MASSRPRPNSTVRVRRWSASCASSTRRRSWTTGSTVAPCPNCAARRRPRGGGLPADTQTLQYRYDAAQCLEQLGEPAAALAEYRAVLPYYENQYATGNDPARSFEIRQRIGYLLLAVGDHAAARGQLQALLYDTERMYGPHHPLPVELRRQLDRQMQVRGG